MAAGETTRPKPPPESLTAARILDRLRKRDLPERFTVHQLKRIYWSGLTDRATINGALAMLVDQGWLSESEIETGGRPRVDFLTPF